VYLIAINDNSISDVVGIGVFDFFLLIGISTAWNVISNNVIYILRIAIYA